MPCSEYQEWMMQRLDGELPEAQWEALCRHMSECRLCSEEWRQISFTVESLRQLPLVEAPDNLLERTMQRIDDLQRQQPRPAQSRSLKRAMRFQPLWMGTAAACLVIFLFSSWWTVAGIQSPGMNGTYMLQSGAPNSFDGQAETMQERSAASDAARAPGNDSEAEEEISIMAFESRPPETDDTAATGNPEAAAASQSQSDDHLQAAPSEPGIRSVLQIGWPYRLLIGVIALGLSIYAYRKSAAAK